MQSIRKRAGHAIAGGKKHAVSIGAGSLLGAALSTGIQFAVQWHDESKQSQAQESAIAAAIAPLKVEIENVKAQNTAQWQAIGKKQDKRP